MLVQEEGSRCYVLLFLTAMKMFTDDEPEGKGSRRSPMPGALFWADATPSRRSKNEYDCEAEDQL
jgi:hypothetical protein